MPRARTADLRNVHGPPLLLGPVHPRIDPNPDPALAEAMERGVGWPREGREVARRFAVDPEGHYVARLDGEVAGTMSCILYGDALAWIGGMVVSEKTRGRGVGRALLSAGLARAEAKGVRIAGLEATDFGRPLYEKMGFEKVGETLVWKREPDAPPRAAPAPADYAIYPISFSELMEVSDYDRARFGASRARAIAEVLADFPARAFLAYHRGTGALAGYVMGQERFVGPLVADAPEAAAWLLYAAEQAGTPPLVMAPDGNPHAAIVLTEAGYAKTTRRCTRMARGGALPGRVETQYAIASWALG